MDPFGHWWSSSICWCSWSLWHPLFVFFTPVIGFFQPMGPFGPFLFPAETSVNYIWVLGNWSICSHSFSPSKCHSAISVLLWPGHSKKAPSPSWAPSYLFLKGEPGIRLQLSFQHSCFYSAILLQSQSWSLSLFLFLHLPLGFSNTSRTFISSQCGREPPSALYHAVPYCMVYSWLCRWSPKELLLRAVC